MAARAKTDRALVVLVMRRLTRERGAPWIAAASVAYARPVRTRLVALALALSACSSPPPRCPDRAPRAPDPPAARAPAAPSGPSVAITVKATPGAPRVDVEIVAAADPDRLATFSIATPAGAVHLAEVRDSIGALEVKLAARPDGRAAFTMPRPTSGPVHVAYAVDAAPGAGGVVPGVDVDPNRFVAAGEPLLLLPDGLDERAVHAMVRVVADPFVVNDERESFVGGASSFGAGSTREVDIHGGALRRGVYLAGPIGRARFDAPEGHDEAVWLGYTAFDPRPIAADVAAFRTAAREIFRAGDDPALTLLILPDARRPGAFAAARRARSVLVRLGTGETWSAPLRIAVAVEVLRAWIGERLYIGKGEPGREAEAYWFTEGLTRHLARDLLFRFGLISPADVADEVNGLTALAVTSPLHAASNVDLARRAREPGAVPLLVARGALYATAVAARIRAKSKGAESLDSALRGLMDRARAARGPLPDEAWIDAITAAAGPGEGERFAAAIGAGKAEDLPDGALGPCFRRAPRTFAAFDLGFDEDATRAAADRRVAGLRPGGPAEKAGLRPGDALVDAVIGRGRSDVPVSITVERDGARRTVKYLPAGPQGRGMGFSRKPDVPDEACYR